MNRKAPGSRIIYGIVIFFGINSCDIFDADQDKDQEVPEEETTVTVDNISISYLDTGLEQYTFYDADGNGDSYSISEATGTFVLDWKGEIDLGLARTGLNGALLKKEEGVDSIFVYQVNKDTQEKKFVKLFLMVPSDELNDGYFFYIENYAYSGKSLEHLKKTIEDMSSKRFRKTFPGSF